MRGVLPTNIDCYLSLPGNMLDAVSGSTVKYQLSSAASDHNQQISLIIEICGTSEGDVKQLTHCRGQ